MHSKSCGHCLEWTTSDDTLLDALRGRWRARKGCDHQPLMHVAIEQWRKSQPFWWVVGSAVVVPVWVVEHLTKRARMLAASADSTAHHVDHALDSYWRRAEFVPAADFLDIDFELHGGSLWRAW